MPICVVLIGFSKSQKESQKVDAYLNGDKVNWKRSGSEWNGTFTTPTSKRLSMIWFLAKLECDSGSVIKLETSVFIRGMGPDEERSRTIEFLVDESVVPTDFDIKKVGDPKFSLLSGPVVLINSRSKLDDRHDAAEHLMREAQNQGNLDDGDQSNTESQDGL